MQQQQPTATSLAGILRRHLTPAIEMLQDAIENCPEDVWTLAPGPPSENVPVWEQVYHATFWLNAWARDWSTPLEKPEFHSNEALELESSAYPVASREQMRAYLNKAKCECMSFLDSLTDEALLAEEEAFGRTFTPADRLIGQIRHVQYHAGMANAAVEAATGQWPRWRAFNE